MTSVTAGGLASRCVHQHFEDALSHSKPNPFPAFASAFVFRQPSPFVTSGLNTCSLVILIARAARHAPSVDARVVLRSQAVAPLVAASARPNIGRGPEAVARRARPTTTRTLVAGGARRGVGG